MSMNVADWESAAPWIDWREPVEVRLMGDDTAHYACRVCIAVVGMRGSDIPRLPTDPEEVRRHMARAHVK